MFKDDDEDDDAGALGATRYPCMPSLVALQQMRNRLHLAYVGKKLMKWTAMATGREMRRMAAEINETHTSFYEDVRDAFMYLARSRYFIQDLNQMVVENVHGQAHATVSTVNKTISGVKVLQFEVLEEGPECYEHLGIARGGKAVEDAKEAWIALLRRIIFMLELRTSFGLVEMANKSATKKQNDEDKTKKISLMPLELRKKSQKEILSH